MIVVIIITLWLSFLCARNEYGQVRSNQIQLIYNSTNFFFLKQYGTWKHAQALANCTYRNSNTIVLRNQNVRAPLIVFVPFCVCSSDFLRTVLRTPDPVGLHFYSRSGNAWRALKKRVWKTSATAREPWQKPRACGRPNKEFVIWICR